MTDLLDKYWHLEVIIFPGEKVMYAVGRSNMKHAGRFIWHVVILYKCMFNLITLMCTLTTRSFFPFKMNMNEDAIRMIIKSKCYALIFFQVKPCFVKIF